MSDMSNQQVSSTPTPQIKSEFQVRNDAGEYNVGTKQTQLIHEEYNTVRNFAPIMERVEAGTARDISDEPVVDGTPFFLLGSGPSLDDNVEKLRDWKGGIFCTTSHALTLMHYGIEPTHIVALDPFCSWPEIEGVDWSKTKTKLVTHPGVWPDLIANWPNEMLLYRQDMGKSDSFYATTQMRMFTRRTGDRPTYNFDIVLRTSLMLFANSPPAQLFVAQKLGYGTCFLMGLDLCYHSGKSRFTNYTVKKPAITVTPGNAAPVTTDAEWEAHPNPFTKPSDDVVDRSQNEFCITENGMVTTRVNLFYKLNFISAWRLCKQTIYSTDKGSLTEVPYISPVEAIRTQGRAAKPWTEDRICKAAERYMARSGNYVLVTEDGGQQFVQSPNPEVDLVHFMAEMNRQLECSKGCGLRAQSNTPLPPKNEKCPQCKDGMLVQRKPINIRKNMERIYVLMDYAVNKNAEAAPSPSIAGGTPAIDVPLS